MMSNFLLILISLVLSVYAQTTDNYHRCTKSTECKDGCCTDLYTDPYFRLPLYNETAYLTMIDGTTYRKSYYSLNICIPNTTLIDTKIDITQTKLYPEDIFSKPVYYIRNACYIPRTVANTTSGIILKIIASVSIFYIFVYS